MVAALCRCRRNSSARTRFSLANAATKEPLEPAIAKLARFVGKSERKKLSATPIEQWLRYEGALQGEEAWATFGDWIDRTNPRFGFERPFRYIREAFLLARQFRLSDEKDSGEGVIGDAENEELSPEQH